MHGLNWLRLPLVRAAAPNLSASPVSITVLPWPARGANAATSSVRAGVRARALGFAADVVTTLAVKADAGGESTDWQTTATATVTTGNHVAAAFSDALGEVAEFGGVGVTSTATTGTWLAVDMLVHSAEGGLTTPHLSPASAGLFGWPNRLAAGARYDTTGESGWWALSDSIRPTKYFEAAAAAEGLPDDFIFSTGVNRPAMVGLSIIHANVGSSVGGDAGNTPTLPNANDCAFWAIQLGHLRRDDNVYPGSGNKPAIVWVDTGAFVSLPGRWDSVGRDATAASAGTAATFLETSEVGSRPIRSVLVPTGAADVLRIVSWSTRSAAYGSSRSTNVELGLIMTPR